MIKHIVMWRFADQAEGADKATNLRSVRDRRAALAGIKAAATLFWLGDRSEDHAATAHFLRRRIGRALAADDRAGRLGARLAQLAEAPWRLAGTIRHWTADRRRPAD
mgnify:CR=1 FL=1